MPTEVVAGMPQYLTSFARRNGKGEVVLWRLKETSHGLRLTNVAIKVGHTTFAPWGFQGGGSTGDPHTWWDTGDLRLINASYDPATGFIYTANAVAHDFAPSARVESAVRWYEVQPAGSLPNSAVTRNGYVGAVGLRRRMAVGRDRRQRQALRELQPGEPRERRVPVDPRRHGSGRLDGRDERARERNGQGTQHQDQRPTGDHAA